LAKEMSPYVWGIICDLVGGEEKITDDTRYWRDNFIVNLGSEETQNLKEVPRPEDLTNWHFDGDNFLHFLDSSERGVITIPLWSDEIKHGGGPTFIAPDSISVVAKHLESHPEGVMPGLRLDLVKQCKEFVELTGKLGDVLIMHPYMLHSASPNILRIPRFMTNPAVTLKEPFNYNQSFDKLSIVERTTLRALGKKAPYDYKITSPRKYFLSKRYYLWHEMHEDAIKRLKAYGTVDAFSNDPKLLEVAANGTIDDFIGRSS